MNIRKILLYILLTGTTSLTFSCKEDLIDISPLTNNTANDFYADENQMNQAVMAVYNAYMIIPVSSNWYLSEVRSDNTLEINGGGAQRDWADIGFFTATSQTGAFASAWTNLYAVAYRANMVINNAVKFNSAKVTAYQAEARFLRALAYFDLVRFWGDVPLVLKPLSIDEAKKTPRTSKEEVYKVIIEDLKFAVDNLPETYAVADKGRSTKYAAKSVLGRVYLTMSGYPLKQTDKLSLAKKELADVMAQESRFFAFPATYRDLFTVAGENKSNPFEVQYLSGGLGLGSQVPAVQAFQYPVQWSTQQPTDGFDGQPDGELLRSYTINDTRFKASIDSGYSDAAGKRLSERIQFTKFLEKGAAISNNRDYPTNFPVVRYNDVLLMYAEILNEESGPTAEAVAILNRIRTFAKAPVIKPATKEDFRLAIESERRIEFVAEGLRWHDLVRTGRAITVMNAFAQRNLYKMARPISESDLYYPIPQKEMLINPGFWQQNPGY